LKPPSVYASTAASGIEQTSIRIANPPITRETFQDRFAAKAGGRIVVAV
jgi:hypothetical protein